MNVRKLVLASFQDVKEKKIEASTKRVLHGMRSTEWVESLARCFRDFLGSDGAVRVFSKHSPTNRQDFGLNELLHDVTVCSVGKVDAAIHNKKLLFVKEVLWQVESEFARDSRQALIDFNKLVLGSAKNKLFVGSQVRDLDSFIKVLSPAASVCTGNVYAAFIPHPSKWGVNLLEPEVFKFSKKQTRWIQYP